MNADRLHPSPPLPVARRRSWRVAVQLAGPPCVLGVAILSADTATAAAQICRAQLPACTVFDVESATK